MQLAYKLVHRDTRYGSNFAGYIKSRAIWKDLSQRKQFIESTEDFLREKHLQDYFPLYTPGALVKMAPSSAGIFCFTSKEQAEDFAKYTELEESTIIVEVHGLGIPLRPSIFLPGCFDIWKLDIYQLRSRRTLKARFSGHPTTADTILFRAVRVLE